MRKQLFIKNTFFLTATSVALRIAGMYFRIFLTGIIGNDGIGSYQLLISAFVFFSTFISGGLTTAATRQIGDRLCQGKINDAKKVLKISAVKSVVISIAIFIFITLFKQPLALLFTKNKNLGMALQIMGLTLIPLGITAVMRGWFIAKNKAIIPSVAVIISQVVRLFIVFLTLKPGCGVEKALVIVVLCDFIGETSALIFTALFYLKENKKTNCSCKNTEKAICLIKEHIHISLPLTMGQYLSTAIRTAESILIPSLLAKNMSETKALATFGLVKGMALPILFFPSAILSSVTTLLIPKLSAAKKCCNRILIRYYVEKNLKLTFLFSLAVSVVIYSLSDKISLILYNSHELTPVLKALSPIIPVMYLDSMACGILKGIDRQTTCFVIGLTDSAVRLLLIFILIPINSVNGFLEVMYISNLFTCISHMRAMFNAVNCSFYITKELLYAVAVTLVSVGASNIVCTKANCGENILYCLIFCAISFIIYVVAYAPALWHLMHKNADKKRRSVNFFAIK